MVQLNPVPVFGAKKNTSTIWRKMVSADRNENQENRKKENFTEQIHVHFRPS